MRANDLEIVAPGEHEGYCADGSPVRASATLTTYALVSPVRSEAANLERIASCLQSQTVAPSRWIIVDNGSTDGDARRARRARTSARMGRERRRFPARSVPCPGRRSSVPSMRASSSSDALAGRRREARRRHDVRRRPLRADPRGVRGGSPARDHRWRMPRGERRRVAVRHTSLRTTSAERCVRTAVSACSRSLPLEDGMGWDGIDELKAQSRGWRRASSTDLSFRHHRPVGAREAAAVDADSPRAAVRTTWGIARRTSSCARVYQSRRDPRALAMIVGYLDSAVRRRPILDDPSAVGHLREKQRLRSLRARAREAGGEERHGGGMRWGGD